MSAFAAGNGLWVAAWKRSSAESPTWRASSRGSRIRFTASRGARDDQADRLERRTEPRELARVLSEDARRRGL